MIVHHLVKIAYYALYALHFCLVLCYGYFQSDY